MFGKRMQPYEFLLLSDLCCVFRMCFAGKRGILHVAWRSAAVMEKLFYKTFFDCFPPLVSWLHGGCFVLSYISFLMGIDSQRLGLKRCRSTI